MASGIPPAVWKKLGEILGETLISTIFSEIISYAIDSVFGSTTDPLIEVIEAAQKNMASLDFTPQYDKNEVIELGKRYEELLRGVKILNGELSNKSLSFDEYYEFLDISDQLSTTFPNLLSNYDSNGNAILTLGSNAQSATKDLKSLLDANQLIQNTQQKDVIQNSFDSINEEIERSKPEINNLTMQAKYKRKLVKSFDSTDVDNTDFMTYEIVIPSYIEGSETLVNSVKDALLDRNESYEPFTVDELRRYSPDGKANVTYLNSFSLTQEELAEIKETISAQNSNILNSITQSADQDMYDANALNTIVNEKQKQLIGPIKSYFQNSPLFTDLSGILQSGIFDAVDNLNFNAIPKDTNIIDYIENTLLNPVVSASPKVKEAFAELFKLNSDDNISIDDYQIKLNEVKKLFTDEGTTLPNGSLNQKSNFNLFDFHSKKEKLLSNVENITNKEMGDLSTKEFNIAYDLVINDNFSGTFEELKVKIEKTKHALKESESEKLTNDPKADISSYKTKMVSIQSAMSNLDNLSSIDKINLSQSLGLDENKALSTTQGIREEMERIAGIELNNIIGVFDSLLDNKIIDQNTYDAYISTFTDMKSEAVNAADSIKSIPEAISDLQSTNNVIETVKKELDGIGEISLDTISSLSASYPKLNTVLSKYLTKQASGKDVLEELQGVYKENEEAYHQSVTDKLINDEAYFSEVKVKNANFFSQLTSTYAEDAESWKTLADVKATIEQALLIALNQSWSQHFKMVLGEDGNYKADFRGNSAGSYGVKYVKGIPTLDQAAADKISNDKKNADKYVADFNTNNSIINNILNEALGEINAIKYPGAGGAGSSKDKGSSGSASSSKKTIDWISRKLEVLSNYIDILKNKAEDAFSSYKKQNNALDKAAKIMKRQLTVYDKAYDSYMKKAKSVGLSKKLQEKVKNGAYDITDYSDETAQKIEEFQKWYDEASNVKNRISEIKKELKETASMKMDNIIAYYSNKSSYRKSNISLREAKIKNPAYQAKESDYQYLIKEQKNNKKNAIEEYHKLEKEMEKGLKNKEFKKYDPTWLSYMEQLNTTKEGIYQCDEAVEEYKKSIEELNFKPFEDGTKKVQNMQDELNDLIGLMDGLSMDESGNITAHGLAKVALNMNGMITAKQDIINAEAAMKKLDSSTADYNEKLVELQKQQRDGAKSYQTYRNTILDFKKNAIEAETEAKRKLAQSSLDALDAEKSLTDYKKSQEEKLKGIALLEKKIAELSLSDSRKDIALRLELEKELAGAKEGLEEEQKNHNLEMQKEGINKGLSDYEDSQNQKIKDLETNTKEQERVIQEYLVNIKADYTNVYGEISNITKAYGISMSEDLMKPFVYAMNSADNYFTYLDKLKTNHGITPSNPTNTGSFDVNNLPVRRTDDDLNWLLKHASNRDKIIPGFESKPIPPNMVLTDSFYHNPMALPSPQRAAPQTIAINSPLMSVSGITSDEINKETQRLIAEIPNNLMRTLRQNGVR